MKYKWRSRYIADENDWEEWRGEESGWEWKGNVGKSRGVQVRFSLKQLIRVIINLVDVDSKNATSILSF